MEVTLSVDRDAESTVARVLRSRERVIQLGEPRRPSMGRR